MSPPTSPASPTTGPRAPIGSPAPRRPSNWPSRPDGWSTPQPERDRLDPLTVRIRATPAAPDRQPYPWPAVPHHPQSPPPPPPHWTPAWSPDTRLRRSAEVWRHGQPRIRKRVPRRPHRLPPPTHDRRAFGKDRAGRPRGALGPGACAGLMDSQLAPLTRPYGVGKQIGIRGIRGPATCPTVRGDSVGPHAVLRWSSTAPSQTVSMPARGVCPRNGADRCEGAEYGRSLQPYREGREPARSADTAADLARQATEPRNSEKGQVSDE